MKDKINPVCIDLKESGIRYFHNLAQSYESCIDFSIGEPKFDVSELIKEETKKALDLNKTHYVLNQGNYELRKAIVEFENKRKKLHYISDEVLITQGASEAISCVFFTILDQEDEVLIPLPAYSGYENAISLARGKAIFFECLDYEIKEEMLESNLTKKTKAILITTPNNPSGREYASTSLANVAKLAKQFQLFVILDLVYDQMTDIEQDLHEFEGIKEQCILIHSFSKSYAMTGFRLGYLMASQNLMPFLLKVHQSTVSCINSFVQVGAIAAFQVENDLYERIKEKRKILVDLFKREKIEFVEPNGTFYLYLPVHQYHMSSDEFVLKLLEEEQVLCIPGSVFHDDTSIRIAYGIDKDELIKGALKLVHFIQRLRN